jgi:hypothetical protein
MTEVTLSVLCPISFMATEPEEMEIIGNLCLLLTISFI